MEVSYSVGGEIGEGGVGGVTKYALKAIKKAGYLKQQITLKEIPLQYNEYFGKNNAFDIMAALILKKCDILHSWNGFCYAQFLKAKGFGAIKVCDRQSSHVIEQNKIMEKENARFGIKRDANRSYTLTKCVAEYNLADYVLVPSIHAWNSFLKYNFPGHKLYMIRNGVDLKKFQPKPVKHNDFRVLFVGGNWIRKGWIYLERAFAQLNLKNSELWGAGPRISFTKRRNVKLLGFIPSQKLYNKCDLFVLPTLEDEMALVVLEAMASGIPVITTFECGYDDIIKDGKQGFIVPVRDERTLKQRIQYFYDNPSELKRMGKNARKTAEKYPWEKYQKELIKFYEMIYNAR